MTDLYGMARSDDILSWIKAQGVEPLYLCVSGSHMWGLQQRDSDLDVRGIYLAPLDQVLSLRPGKAVEPGVIEGLNLFSGNVDLQLFELRKFFSMLVKPNGNAVEMLLAPTCFFDARTVRWGDLATKYLTRKLSNHFAGYYQSQRKRAAQNRGGKSLLYSYRELMCGIMLMRTGEITFDFHRLKREFAETFNWESPMLDYFMGRAEWGVPVSEERLNRFEVEWEGLVELLHKEEQTSILPENYEDYDELNSLLLSHRLDHSTYVSVDDMQGMGFEVVQGE